VLSKTFNLLFFLKKPKNYRKGEMPIYVRLTVDGKRIELSAQRGCEPEKWNASSGRKNGTKEDVRVLNAYLDTLQNQLYNVHSQLVYSGLWIATESLKCRLSGNSEKSFTLLEAFQKHQEYHPD
jgi:hypothetical protein